MKQCNNETMFLNSNIDNLPSTSKITVNKLKSIGINTYWDLLNYFPFRYENYSLISPISRIQNGETVTVKGKLVKFENFYTKKGLKIQKAQISDQTGNIDAVWYNQPYLYRVLKAGQFVSISGEVKGFFKDLSLEVREYEIISGPDTITVHTGRMISIYPEKKGLSSRLLRDKIFNLIYHSGFFSTKNGISEFFPQEIISYNNLIAESDAYKQIHFPENTDLAIKARQRLAFDELFTIQLSAKLIKQDWNKENVTNAFHVETSLMTSLQKFIQNLPFELTTAQKRVINEIISDLKKPAPMNRFLEGDVGSGKTVVAALAGYLAFLNGFRALIMAPTEILAIQHYNTLSSLFKSTDLKVALRTSSITSGTKSVRSYRLGISSIGSFDMIIGTHALLNQKLNFEKVGLVIIDEQHRFGVVQRAKLKEKGLNPHLLTMTATPIPRTVALTLYGELDLSVIDEMPKGRQIVKTFLVPQQKRESGYEWIKKKIKEEKIQVFIICPLIEESENETMKSVKAASREYERLKKEIFPEFKLELLHGKTKSKEKERIMQSFKSKNFDILVSTPVVEVGIDIPNATVMLIEGADRFGLAQLHQLRGRVGRGEKQSYCLLYSESKDEKVSEKLNFFSKTQSGIQVAEYDLKMRGPGEIYGTRQHGFLDLKVASLSDFELIAKSKKAVEYFVNKYQFEKFADLNKRLQDYRYKQISRD